MQKLQCGTASVQPGEEDEAQAQEDRDGAREREGESALATGLIAGSDLSSLTSGLALSL